MRTIVIANQKGGCGKTTVAINLSACLANLGQRTLLIDMDPQGHCAVGLGVPEADIKHSTFELLAPSEKGIVPLAEMVWRIENNFDLLPATLELAKFEPMMVAHANRENRLRDALAGARPEYDIVIIDCPPSLSLLTFNALCAADEVLIPVETGFFALHGLSRQLEVVESLQVLTARTLGVRVLCNLYDIRTKASRKIVAQIREHFGDVLARTVINLNTKLKAAAAVGQPITEFDRASIGYHDFMALAKELTEQQAATEPLANNAELLAHADSISRQAEQLLVDSAKLVAGSVADRLDASDPLATMANMTVDGKLEKFYGVRQTADGVEFSVEAPHAEAVYLAGDFNDWSPHATPLAQQTEDGQWSAKLKIAPGRHHYRYVIDGRWRHDPSNNYHESNPYGELNSIVEVQ
ncbi:MAG: AAA family ATPase [Phycisphaerae bacterium]|nr:AAA family ATPase [Phycisphaerae bacterium]